jgi:23S rRNA pseudouridine2605 synthase
MERLQKYLARAGVASRRASERLIIAGRVRVNGAVVAELGSLVRSDRDIVEVDGQVVKPDETRCYVLLHKPAGVVSTAADPRGRRTVLDLVPGKPRIFPVGRLDYDSEGLLLLTNDGHLTLRLTHPRHAVEKEYRALVRGRVDSTVLDRLRRGVMLDGSETAPCIVEVVERNEPLTWLRIVLHEGRNRQIRRMADVVGLQVTRLIRVRLGALVLGGLAPGAWRELTPHEVGSLLATGA